ncbi:MAG: phenylalanine--tRNA ligase subunit beta [Candidatus Omnitrophica bacterium]|nr:phenylalanine--tRNA ligase subunit beta [Candidatus Omnitrophota bacterium]
MKFTYNWLKDFLDLKISAAELAEKLTMAGLEVTSLEERAGDFIFEVEITSNRPDWLSVIGIAREVAAITNSKLRTQGTKSKLKVQNKSQAFKINIEDKKDCPLYTLKIIQGVNVGPSPDWLKNRLELIGCRSVNNIVDITNYVLFETGEPLHAFDLDKLAPGAISVRRAKKDEKLTTIDAAQRVLNQEILVIADGQKALAAAGIMGGKGSEVSYATKNILLEAAIFHPVVIRRARQMLGLQTDSSYRFERGIDAETVRSASLRATQLITELSGGKCVSAIESGSAKISKKTVSFDMQRMNKFLGSKIPAVKIKNILSHLGFQIRSKSQYVLTAVVPPWRADVSLEVDLIEEVSRIFGYEHIPSSLPEVKPQVNINTPRDLVVLIKNTLVSLGLNEVITYSLIDRDWLKDFNLSVVQPVEVQNPLSKEQEILRPSIVPSLARVVAFNLNRKQNYLNIFEVSKVFCAGKPDPNEDLVLGIALCGEKAMLLNQGMVREELNLLHLKGIIESVLKGLGISGYSFNLGSGHTIILEKDNQQLGTLGQLPPRVLGNLDIKNKEVVAAEINLKKIFPLVNLHKKFISLPTYPGITRDISLLLKNGIKIEDVLCAIRKQAEPLLKEAAVVDFYKGKQIPSGHKGLTISCLYRSDTRTLTEEEVNPLHAAILAVLQEKFNAQLR